MDKSIAYEDRLVAFIDILGFASIVRNSEFDANRIMNLYSILSFLKMHEKLELWDFGIKENGKEKDSGTENEYESQNALKWTTFSDSIVVSCGIEERSLSTALSILVANLAWVGLSLCQSNILWRGAISIGKLIQDDKGIVMGSGMIDAYNIEKSEAIYPRIILSQKLLSQINDIQNGAVKSYPYQKYIECYEGGYVGFHQLKFLETFVPVLQDKEKDFSPLIYSCKKFISNGIVQFRDDPRVLSKYLWMRDAYNRLQIDEKLIGRIT